MRVRIGENEGKRAGTWSQSECRCVLEEAIQRS